jgi:hypothetical protein
MPRMTCPRKLTASGSWMLTAAANSRGFSIGVMKESGGASIFIMCGREENTRARAELVVAWIEPRLRFALRRSLFAAVR